MLNQYNFKLILSLFILIGHVGMAQQSPVTTGGTVSGTNGSVSYTIGQLVDDSYSNGNYAVTPGLQQPYEVFNPLPLKFLSFTASLFGNQTLLNWKTANEQNVNHFEIEKKVTSDNDFSFLATVKAKENTGEEEYQYIDHSLSEGVAYYRLKEVDNNGLDNYSQIVLVNLQSSNMATLKVYPNPVLTQMNITFNVKESKLYHLHLIDALGRIVISKQVNCVQGSNTINWNVAQLVAGEYILKAMETEISPIKIIRNK